MSFFFSRIIMSTYLGYHDRVKCMVDKWESHKGANNKLLNMRTVYITFFYGLAMVGIRRRKSSKNIPELARLIALLKSASRCSRWNFLNKLYLLEAVSGN